MRKTLKEKKIDVV